MIGCLPRVVGLPLSEVPARLDKLNRARGKDPGWPGATWQAQVVERYQCGRAVKRFFIPWANTEVGKPPWPPAEVSWPSLAAYFLLFQPSAHPAIPRTVLPTMERVSDGDILVVICCCGTDSQSRLLGIEASEITRGIRPASPRSNRVTEMETRNRMGEVVRVGAVGGPQIHNGRNMVLRVHKLIPPRPLLELSPFSAPERTPSVYYL